MGGGAGGIDHTAGLAHCFFFLFFFFPLFNALTQGDIVRVVWELGGGGGGGGGRGVDGGPGQAEFTYLCCLDGCQTFKAVDIGGGRHRETGYS